MTMKYLTILLLGALALVPGAQAEDEFGKAMERVKQSAAEHKQVPRSGATARAQRSSNNNQPQAQQQVPRSGRVNLFNSDGRPTRVDQDNARNRADLTPRQFTTDPPVVRGEDNDNDNNNRQWRNHDGNWQNHDGNYGHHGWDRGHHNRSWWRSRYSRFSFFGGGCYYWNNGFWYPAYGYSPSYSSYAYDAPMYAYNDRDPSQIIATVQRELGQRGFYRGSLDGAYGPMTRRALLNFQGENGLPRSGQIDQNTLSALGLR